MLHKLDLGSDQIVGFSWEGKYDEKAVKQSIGQFLPELRSRAHMNVYLELYEISQVEAKAVWEDLKFSVKNYQEITDKVEKFALVTNVDWVRNLASASSSVISGIKLKTFTFQEKDAARLWVSE